ncbi:hypothetical protein LTR27_002909 [Elasticomyces elasticus]|nr:hypothetical protein LTR27_002909 [Elasticomyces elasticus]
MSSVTIPSTVNQCFDAFDSLYEAAEAGSELGLALQEERGRFKVWTANISAHRAVTSRRSLEYRLRDSSNLRDTVKYLLQDLLQALQALADVAPSNHDLDSAAEVEANAFVDEDDDFDFGTGAFTSEDEEQRLLEDIHDVVNCLMRFSMTLRNPARHDHMRYSATSNAHHYEPFDREHVRSKYPEAPDYLVDRLGKSISRHRLYFDYREQHHAKLAEGLEHRVDQGEGTVHEQASTIATSVHKDVERTPRVHDSDDESVYTATSFASSASGQRTLRPPPLPAEGMSGDPFECKICFTMVIADNERAWRQHVYEDLPPYVCMLESCATAHQPYARRREWQQHEREMHYRTWACPYGCIDVLATPELFQAHVVRDHDQKLDDPNMQRMIDACAQPLEDESTTSQCPLCQRTIVPQKRFFKHLGHHLEELALFSLPSHLHGDESDAESNGSNVSDVLQDGIDVQREIDSLEEQLDSGTMTLVDEKKALAELSQLERQEKASINLTAAAMLSGHEGESHEEESDDDSTEETLRTPPILFNDGVGRKFRFPWKKSKTWEGMELLIKQAFMPVARDFLSEHVHKGHYDLIGSDGQIILPRVWNTMIRPGEEVTMHMWPMPEREERNLNEDVVDAGSQSETIPLPPLSEHVLVGSVPAHVKRQRAQENQDANQDDDSAIPSLSDSAPRAHESAPPPLPSPSYIPETSAAPDAGWQTDNGPVRSESGRAIYYPPNFDRERKMSSQFDNARERIEKSKGSKPFSDAPHEESYSEEDDDDPFDEPRVKNIDSAQLEQSEHADKRLEGGQQGPASYANMRASVASASLTEADRFLLQLKENEHLPWKDIAIRFQDEYGNNYRVAALQMRYKRIMAQSRLPEQEEMPDHQEPSYTRALSRDRTRASPKPDADRVHSAENAIYRVLPEHDEDEGEDAGHATESRPVASSYWSLTEQQDFVKYISHFGTDFAAIAALMGTKTRTMIKNHYLRQIQIQSELETAAREADKRRNFADEGDTPPAPTPNAKCHNLLPLQSRQPPLSLNFNLKYLELETLKYYDIPYELDRHYPGTVNILREMNTDESDVLFEHTRKLREGRNSRTDFSKLGSAGTRGDADDIVFVDEYDEEGTRFARQFPARSERKVHVLDISDEERGMDTQGIFRERPILRERSRIRIRANPAGDRRVDDAEETDAITALARDAVDPSDEAHSTTLVHRPIGEMFRFGEGEHAGQGKSSPGDDEDVSVSNSRTQDMAAERRLLEGIQRRRRNQLQVEGKAAIAREQAHEALATGDSNPRRTYETGLDRTRVACPETSDDRMRAVLNPDRVDTTETESEQETSSEHMGEKKKNEQWPVYPKVHRRYLDVDTLAYYGIPFERDRVHPDYFILLRQMDKYETDILFEHTRKLRSAAGLDLISKDASPFGAERQRVTLEQESTLEERELPERRRASPIERDGKEHAKAMLREREQTDEGLEFRRTTTFEEEPEAAITRDAIITLETLASERAHAALPAETRGSRDIQEIAVGGTQTELHQTPSEQEQRPPRGRIYTPNVVYGRSASAERLRQLEGWSIGSNELSSGPSAEDLAEGEDSEEDHGGVPMAQEGALASNQQIEQAPTEDVNKQSTSNRRARPSDMSGDAQGEHSSSIEKQMMEPYLAQQQPKDLSEDQINEVVRRREMRNLEDLEAQDRVNPSVTLLKSGRLAMGLKDKRLRLEKQAPDGKWDSGIWRRYLRRMTKSTGGPEVPDVAESVASTQKDRQPDLTKYTEHDDLVGAEDSLTQGAGSALSESERFKKERVDVKKRCLKGDKVWLKHPDGGGMYAVVIEEAQFVAGTTLMEYRLSYHGRVVDYEGSEWFSQKSVSKD